MQKVTDLNGAWEHLGDDNHKTISNFLNLSQTTFITVFMLQVIKNNLNQT